MYYVFAILAVIAIIFAFIFRTEKQWYFLFLMGLATDLCVFISMITLGMKIVEEGRPGNMLTAVYGQWGADYPIIRTVYTAAYIVGVIVAAYGLIRIYIFKKKGVSDGNETGI